MCRRRSASPHLQGELVDPFVNAAGHIWPKRPADIPAPVAERKQA